jgi:hypothetical protein
LICDTVDVVAGDAAAAADDDDDDDDGVFPFVGMVLITAKASGQ